MDTPQTFLLVDDDVALCSLMSDFFGREGYRTESVHDGREALAVLTNRDFDLVILDVMMPVLDGFEVLQQIRKRSAVPVIMLTARTSGADRVSGLNTGADDYLPKPFDPAELLARIRAVLRRVGKGGQPENQIVESCDVRLNSGTREVWLHGEPVKITAIEFDILDYLMRAAGRVVSRDALAAVLYQREATPFERSIDVHISHLRRKLGKGDDEVIRTMRGAGYLFARRAAREE
jgi:two-component system response regulator CpxR